MSFSANFQHQKSALGSLCRRAWFHLQPKHWTATQIRRGTLAFFALTLPFYVWYGFQPRLSAEATTYPTLAIAAIGLSTPVEPLTLANGELTAPATIAGSYSHATNTTLIIGHNTTVFTELDELAIGDTLTYADTTYQVTDLATVPKTDINMNALLAARDVPTLILMTCAGTPLGGQDYTDRLIITAEQL